MQNHGQTYLLISVLTLPLSVAIFFDVKRYAADPKDGNEPYKPVNYFLNKQRERSICLFMFCWHRYGNCKSIADCCECRCKEESTFFSDPDGCETGKAMTNMSRDRGNECHFATKKFGFNYVPLFHNASRFVNIELEMPRRRSFLLNDRQTVCNAGSVHDYDYHGHKLLYDRNHCNHLFQVHRRYGKQYLQFHSRNMSIWKFSQGRLLSVDIDCYSPKLQRKVSSCFMFQVEGKYVAGNHWDEPPVTPAGSTCPNADPTNVPVRRTKRKTIALTSTEGKTTVVTTTTATTTIPPATTSLPTSPTLKTTLTKVILPTTNIPTTLPQVHTTSTPPKTSQRKLKPATQEESEVTSKSSVRATTEVKRLPETTKMAVIIISKDPLTGTTIGILTGLGTGLAIVMVCVIIWILIKKRKDIFMAQQVSTQIFSPDGNTYDEHGYHYDVPNVSIKAVDTPVESSLANDNMNYKYASIDGEGTPSGCNRQYSYIGEKDIVDEHDMESRENTILLKNRGSCKQNADMSKRPLPEKPMEAGNPYYSVASLSLESERTSEPNDLYSLYSTIDDLKQPGSQ